MDKKYYLTDETKEEYGFTFKRARSLQEFADVKAGEYGGWLESEDNLSHEGNCWVYDNAKVAGGARVSENAKVKDQVLAILGARIWGNSIINGAVIVGDAETMLSSSKGKFKPKAKLKPKETKETLESLES